MTTVRHNWRCTACGRMLGVVPGSRCPNCSGIECEPVFEQVDDESPQLGLPADRTTGLCNATPVPRADLQACHQFARIHVLCFSRLGPAAGIVSLLTCARHLPIARAVPHYIGEHPVAQACLDPERRYELTFLGMLCHARRSPVW